MAESRLIQQYLIIQNQMLELCNYYFYKPDSNAKKRKLANDNDEEEKCNKTDPNSKKRKQANDNNKEKYVLKL